MFHLCFVSDQAPDEEANTSTNETDHVKSRMKVIKYMYAALQSQKAVSCKVSRHWLLTLHSSMVGKEKVDP